MSNSMAQVCGAQVPVNELAELADLRTHTGLRAAQWCDRLWLSWPPGEPELAVRVLALPGTVLLTRESATGLWRPLEQRLPVLFPPPDHAFRPLWRLLVPGKLDPVAAVGGSNEPAGGVSFRLVQSGVYRPTAGLRAATLALGDWLDTATSGEIACFRAAVSGSGVTGQVLLLGANPPMIAGGVRYWLQPLSRGCQLYVPLGLELWPAVSPARLVDLLGVSAGSILLAEPADPQSPNIDAENVAEPSDLPTGSVLQDSGLLELPRPAESWPRLSCPLLLTVIDGDVLVSASRAALRRALADSLTEDES